MSDDVRKPAMGRAGTAFYSGQEGIQSLSGKDAREVEEGLDSFFSTRPEDYQAHARPASKPLLALHFIPHAIGEIRTIQYFHLDSYHSRFLPLCEVGDVQGNGVILRFNGSTVQEVQIVGINLCRMYDLLCQHRLAWVYEAEPLRAQTLEGTIVYHMQWQEIREGRD